MIRNWWLNGAQEDFAEWRFYVKIALLEFARVAFIGGVILILIVAFGLHFAGIDIGE